VKRLNCEISIGDNLFKWCRNVTISSSREAFTDTATIEMPNRFKNRETKETGYITTKIKINDPVTIKLGYFPNLETRFVGYVSNIAPNSPMVVTCEDASFLLKQSTVGSYSASDTTISALIGDLYDGETDITDAEIGDIRIDQYATLVNVLDDLKSRFGIRSYFQNGVLTIFKEVSDVGNDINLGFQKNIIEHSLEYQNSDALNVISHGVSVQDNGTKIERFAFYFNDEIRVRSEKPEGVLNTFSWPGLTRDALDELISKRLPNLYYTGIKGSLTTFGEPIINHGDNVILEDLDYREREGKYKVVSVETSFGENGYRQVVELDVKI